MLGLGKMAKNICVFFFFAISLYISMFFLVRGSVILPNSHCCQVHSKSLMLETPVKTVEIQKCMVLIHFRLYNRPNAEQF